MTAPDRRYTPPVGARVRMPLMSDYMALGLPAWTMLTATIIAAGAVTCKQQDGTVVTVPLDRVQAPVGWQPKYTIHAAPDKITDVLAWLSRGIVVRFSQYIGDGSVSYQPADNAGTPHWRFTEVTDTIAPEDTRDLIRVVKLETVYDAFIPADCGHCAGTGIHLDNGALRNQTEARRNCSGCGTHMGFSFTEPWHNATTDSEPCDAVHPAGYCWPCHGTGKGAEYLNSIKDRKARARAIEVLERDGWKVWYQKRGQVWRMEREMVVKDFGQEVSV